MAFRHLTAAEFHWRPSNQMSVLNTDIAKQLEARNLGARLWRLKPSQASTRHRHRDQEELYLLLEGKGRVRVDGEVLSLSRLTASWWSLAQCASSSTTLAPSSSGSLSGPLRSWRTRWR